ncbi:MAG: hypothetical protein O2913_13245 [Chloroflexi bacterium]|nr:hypothetical protein [Chloroflexota bacterium]
MSVPPEMRQQGEQLFKDHGVTDIWRDLFGPSPTPVREAPEWPQGRVLGRIMSDV